MTRNSGLGLARKSLGIVLAAVALSACATKKPPPPGPPPVPPPPPSSSDTGPSAYPDRSGMSSRNVGAPAPGSERDFVINAGDRVYFEYNAYVLTPDAGRVLDAQAAWLSRYPQVQVRIEGNCDERGTREYNLALGGRRAEAVKAHLTAHGVSPGRITTISYGKERPLDAGDSEDSLAKNRNAHTAITAGATGG